MITQHYHNDRLLTNKQSHQIFHITSRSKYYRNIQKSDLKNKFSIIVKILHFYKILNLLQDWPDINTMWYIINCYNYIFLYFIFFRYFFMGRSRQPLHLESTECVTDESEKRETPILKSRQINLTLRSRSDQSRHPNLLDELSFATLRPKSLLQTFTENLMRTRVVLYIFSLVTLKSKSCKQSY